MEFNMAADVSRQVLDIQDVRNVVSLDLVQNQKIQLQIESNDAREGITAELYTKGCIDDLPCSRLVHNVVHTDWQTYLTITVNPENNDQRFICVLGLLVIISCVTITWMIRKWMKWKQMEQKLTENITTTNCAKELAKDTKEFQQTHNDTSHSDAHLPEPSFTMTQIKKFQASGRVPWILYTTLFVFICLIAIVLKSGAPRFQNSGDIPILKLTLPRDKHIRHIRSYSEEPSIRDLQLHGNGESLVTRLQLLDLSPDCRSNLTACRTHALCNTNSPGGDLKCRCNMGYYLKDLTCTPCQTTCEDGFYMTEQCSTNKDVVCKPCTQCEGSSYEVAVCTSTQDTICIDVTFPLKQFQSRKISLEEMVSWNVSMSKNVFLERLQGVKKLETSLYLSNNRQALQFLWRRHNSGLEINVKVTDVYLIPEYVDIDHIDDTDYIQEASNYPQNLKDQLKTIRDKNCRFPLPDEYDLNLEIAKNKATVARERACNSKNKKLPACPAAYSDGDKYIFQFLDRQCPKVSTTSNRNFHYTVNNILCSGNSQILSSIFNLKVDDPTYLAFPNEECKKSKTECGKCLSRDACDRGSNQTDCCNLGCHQRADCQRYFSNECPPAPIECTQGDITKFSIMPRFQSMQQQFSCHLQHHPPQYLYQLSYEASIPSMPFSLGMRNKDVMYKNFTDHQNGMDHVDYLRMTHHTESKYDDEVILIGTFNTSDPDHIKEYSLHKLKEWRSFKRYPGYNIIHKGLNKFRTKIQFEKPFLFSTATWSKGGCDINVSKIFPSQPIYKKYGKSVKQPDKKIRNGKFIYQILSEGAVPHMRFSIPENTSILSYYKDAYNSVRINPWSLAGIMKWETDTQHWNISISGSLTACPGIFNLEIYTANMDSRLAIYDMLINCPQDFSTSFEIERNSVEFADIFIVVMNDSVSSYQIVLSSIQGPQYFKAYAGTAVAMETGEEPPYLPLIMILTVCICASMALTLLYLYCDRKKSKFIPADITVPKPDLGPQITLLRSIDKVNKDEGLSLQTKCIMITLVVVYVTYALVFTFTSLFALFHLIQAPGLSKVSITTNTSAQVQSQMERTLDKVTEYEHSEMDRMLKLTEQRLKACSNHLKSSLIKSVPGGNSKLHNILGTLFRSNGTVQYQLAEYLNSEQSYYQQEINEFLEEYNRTLDTKLHKIQITYAAYLKSVAENNWFTFPKEVFMQQQILSGHALTKVSDNLTGFLTWLEMDKVQEIFEMREILMNRLLTMMPKVDFSNLLNDTEGQSKVSVDTDFIPSENTFRFTSNNLEYTSTWNDNSRNPNLDSEIIYTKRSRFHISNIKEIIYPIFICVFLVLDSLLLIYRFSWMVKILRMFKTGLEERIPYDSMTRKIYFILTGKEVPRPEDSLDHPYDYYMHNKENIWDENTELYFLYCNAPAKAKEDILKDIWQHKQRQNPKPEVKPNEKNCCLEYGVKLVKIAYRLFISPVFWRIVLICGFVLILCLFAKATNDLVTVESAMFLLDTEAIMPILERQNDITNTVITEYGAYLNEFLVEYKDNVDGEVQMMNNLLLHVAERQTELLNNVISDMCNLAGIDTCDVRTNIAGLNMSDGGMNLVAISTTSCNFLPIHSKIFDGYQESVLLEYIQSELSPLVLNLRSVLFSSMYLLLTSASAMLLCQIIARVIFVHLKNLRHLKMTKIYQLPSMCDQWQDQHSLREKEMYNSQSVIAESCESGVYDMTN